MHWPFRNAPLGFEILAAEFNLHWKRMALRLSFKTPSAYEFHLACCSRTLCNFQHGCHRLIHFSESAFKLILQLSPNLCNHSLTWNIDAERFQHEATGETLLYILILHVDHIK